VYTHRCRGWIHNPFFLKTRYGSNKLYNCSWDLQFIQFALTWSFDLFYSCHGCGKLFWATSCTGRSYYQAGPRCAAVPRPRRTVAGAPTTLSRRPNHPTGDESQPSFESAGNPDSTALRQRSASAPKAAADFMFHFVLVTLVEKCASILDTYQ